MENRKLKVAVYIRVSTEDQENRSTYENQMNVIERYIENRNESLELAGEEYVYKDLGVSGASPIEERPALSQLKNDLQYYSEIGEKPFDLVIVYRLDRVARSLSILLETLELLNNYGVGYISTQEAIDTSTSF
jgi:DNA recombinase, putative